MEHITEFELKTEFLDTVYKNKKNLLNSNPDNFRADLKKIQNNLSKQTRSCQKLLKKITEKLQETACSQIQTKFSKVIRTLLVLETKLKKEHDFVTCRLEEMNQVIKKQRNFIRKLSNSTICRSCNNEIFENNSWKYQDSNISSSRDSSCSFEFEETRSDKLNYEKSDSDEESVGNLDSPKIIRYKKNRKKSYRKNSGSYILNENNMNNDSLLRESIINKRNSLTENQEIHSDKIDNDSDIVNNASLSESNITVIQKINNFNENDSMVSAKLVENKLSDSIHVFDADNEENQENWYASASDQEDEQRTDIYRNNPVLECVNQILLQDINEPPPSPPKTPGPELKNKKIVQGTESLSEKDKDSNHNYYETPIKAVPNFYETPQSIYSNDYEQILSKCSSTPSTPQKIIRKNKILRVPPALPPKPIGLMPTYCLQKSITPSEISNDVSLESEPDYCSISELNLPVKSSFKKISVVAEINMPMNIIEKPVDISPKKESAMVKKTIEKPQIQIAKQTTIVCEKPDIAKKLSKDKDDMLYFLNDNLSPKKDIISNRKLIQDIPKLPQVSEIIIPEDNEEHKSDAEINVAKSTNKKLNKIPYTFSSKINSPIKPNNEVKVLAPNIENFDLSQTFEEFKFDECGLEELNIDNISTGYENKYSDETYVVPDANEILKFKGENSNSSTIQPNPIEALRKQLELGNTSSKIQKDRFSPDFAQTYEYFLECTGLSSKSILSIKK